MPYASQFAHADAVMAHLAGLLPTLADPQLEQKYVGFASVAAATVYELAVKDIFVDFAKKKHKVFEEFVKGSFGRINGRIKADTVKGEYVARFGTKYETKYAKTLQRKRDEYLRLTRRDFLTAYQNILTWRHNFVHTGQPPTTATFAEVFQAYEDGKNLLHCLAASMTR
jgi:hypothetical protein